MCVRKQPGWRIPRNVCVFPESTMIWRRWDMIPIITRCSRCWVTGRSVIISRKRRLLTLGSSLRERWGWIKIDCMQPFLREVRMIVWKKIKRRWSIGNCTCLKIGFCTGIKKIISGKWGIWDLADLVRRFT